MLLYLPVSASVTRMQLICLPTKALSARGTPLDVLIGRTSLTLASIPSDFRSCALLPPWMISQRGWASFDQQGRSWVDKDKRKGKNIYGSGTPARCQAEE